MAVTKAGADAFLEGNLCQMLLAAPGEQAAVIDGSSVLTYDELAARALGTAAALTAAGIRPGDRVAILGPRGADAVAAYFGALASGAIAVMVNDMLKPRQIEYVLEHSGACVLLADRAILARLPRPLDTAVGVMDLDALPYDEDFEPVARTAGDIAQIIYTSGSTGRPKGVTVSHGNLSAGATSVVSYLRISSSDRIAGLLPFSFDYGLNQVLCATAKGAALVIERSPVPARIVRTLADLEVSIVAGVPPLWLQVLRVEAFSAAPLPALRVMTNSGGHLPEKSVRRLRSSQPQADLVLMYGLTEAFRSTFLSPQRVDDKPRSVGQAIPGAEVMVMNRDGRPCRAGEVGEIVHRGPTVALGYWRDPEAGARVFRRDPFRPPGAPYSERVVFSGDLACCDEDGDIFFLGRRDTMIKTLGYRVSPDEVVEVLHASGEIVEAVVSSEPDDLRGASIVAHVVLAEHGSVERLEAFAAQELPRYLQPSRIVARESLELTSSGKYDALAAAHSSS